MSQMPEPQISAPKSRMPFLMRGMAGIFQTADGAGTKNGHFSHFDAP